MSINFYLGESVKYGKSPIVIRVQYRKAGINIRRNTGFSMEPDIWKNRFNIQCLKKYAWIDEIQNTFIQLSKIAQTITVMHHEGIHITTDVVKECMFKIKYKEYLAEADEKTFMPFYRYLDQLYIDFNEGKRMTENGTPYRRGTLTSIKQAIDHYRAFEKKTKRTYNFDDIDMDFYRRYLAFLNDQNYALNTIGKNINWLKSFMNSAQIEGYHTNVAFKNKMFKGARVEVDTIYLTKEDLEKIRAVDLSNKTYGYDLARDIFMIGVWTAQRVSDYNNIKKEDLQTHIIKKVVEKEDPEHPGKMIEAIEKKEVLVVNITQKKTGARVAIPCSTELRKIFEKYNYEIPHLSDQNVNDNMKKIAEWAGLDEPVKIDYIEGGKRKTVIKKKYELIHTHTARRTGATLMYLSGMDFYDIMKITGHSTVQNLKKYIKADEIEVLEKIVDKYDYFD